jgi:hypothetical protein
VAPPHSFPLSSPLNPKKVLTLDQATLGVIGLVSTVGTHSYAIPNRYEVGGLKNNCNNGEELATSYEAHSWLNTRPKEAPPLSLRPYLSPTTAATPTGGTGVDIGGAFVRCWEQKEIEARAFIMQVAAFRGVRTDQMTARNENTPYHIATHSHRPWRSVLRTVDSSRFFALDYSAAATTALHLSHGGGQLPEGGEVVTGEIRKVRRRKGARSGASHRSRRLGISDVPFSVPAAMAPTSVLKPPAICSALNPPSGKHGHGRARRRNRNVLVISPLDAFESASKPREQAANAGSLRRMAATRGVLY